MPSYGSPRSAHPCSNHPTARATASASGSDRGDETIIDAVGPPATPPAPTPTPAPPPPPPRAAPPGRRRKLRQDVVVVRVDTRTPRLDPDQNDPFTHPSATS